MTMPSKNWKREQGSSIVEFSLIAFVFVMLLLGVVEMGRMILVYTTIAHAAKYGARYAIVHGFLQTGSGDTTNTGPTAADIRTHVQNFSGIAPLSTGSVTVQVAYPGTPCAAPSGSPANYPGCPVTVQVTYPFTPLLGYFNPVLSVNLSSTSEGVITY
jgi:Flp pilus assembly protein TadG